MTVEGPIGLVLVGGADMEAVARTLEGAARCVVVTTATALGDALRDGTDAVVTDVEGWIPLRALSDALGSSPRPVPLIALAADCAPPPAVVQWVRDGAADVLGRSDVAELPAVAARAVERARGRSGDKSSKAARLQALGELSAGITHDLNNLLAIGATFVELARDGLVAGDPALSDLDEAHGALTRATALTRHVVSFLRSERGATRLIDLNDLVRSLDRLVSCALGSNVRLQLELAPHLPAILGDATELEQVVLNLVINARDAIPRHGTVTISTSLRSTDVKASMSDAVGRRVVLSVTDDGVGMSEATQREAFEPFFTTKERGTGLGLSNALQIVRRHRGVIRVRSELGRGSTFEVHLPLPGRATSSSAAGMRRLP